MQDALSEIDLSPLDALTGLKVELETLDGRLLAMEQRKAEVAESVYQRVRNDYENRRAALEQQAAPLRASAREQYARLYALLTRSEADHEAARLDREEIDFRHSLGEFDEAEYRQRIADVDEQLSARAANREQALALRQRFVDAFRSEDELRSETAAHEAVTGPNPIIAEPPTTPSDASTQRLQRIEPPAEPEATRVLPTLSAASVGATQTMRVLKADSGSPPRPDQTVVMRSARLVPQNPEAGKLNHKVGLQPLLLGSDERCAVRIAGTAPQHAQLKAGMAGYTLSDLGGGVRVNGVAIEQHLLRHDDIIEIGQAKFAFREG